MSPKRRGNLNRKYVFQPLIFGGDLLVFGGVHPQKTPKKGVSGCKKKTKFRGLEDFFVPNLHQGGTVFSSSSHPFFWGWVQVFINLLQDSHMVWAKLLSFTTTFTSLLTYPNVWMFGGGRITYPTWGYVKIMCLRKRICSPNISGT